VAGFLLCLFWPQNARQESRVFVFFEGGATAAEIEPMGSKYARTKVLTCAIALLLSSQIPSIAFDDDEDIPYRGLGAESCRQYLKDVASDQSAQQLYSAWLSGYVAVAYAKLPAPPFVQDASQWHAVNDWIKRYCANRASDTFLAATVNVLMARERNLQ
jgi:hypothetical protein